MLTILCSISGDLVGELTLCTVELLPGIPDRHREVQRPRSIMSVLSAQMISQRQELFFARVDSSQSLHKNSN